MEHTLKPGDPCPCCGKPILTNDPEKLLVLSWLAWVNGGQKREADAPPPNDPLTLAELREMDGEPVYLVFGGGRGEWAIVHLEWHGCKPASGGAVFFDRYGEHWIAYRRKPEEGTK